MSQLTRDVAFAIAATLAIMLPLLAQQTPQAPTAATGVDLLLIEHTDAGVVERSGRVHFQQYAADSAMHAVLCVDFTADGDLILLDGFDVEVPSCQ